MMDKKKAADLLDNLIDMVEDNHGADYDTALRMGIEAIQKYSTWSQTYANMVEDVISRQAAIDALIERDPNCGIDSAEVIKDLPSAHPEQQWIPCSEPPKESGTYIVTAYDGADKRVTFVKYRRTLKRWDLTGARAYWRILAYKPLPEPWRGEEHGTVD